MSHRDAYTVRARRSRLGGLVSILTGIFRGQRQWAINGDTASVSEGTHSSTLQSMPTTIATSSGMPMMRMTKTLASGKAAEVDQRVSNDWWALCTSHTFCAGPQRRLPLGKSPALGRGRAQCVPPSLSHLCTPRIVCGGGRHSPPLSCRAARGQGGDAAGGAGEPQHGGHRQALEVLLAAGAPP